MRLALCQMNATVGDIAGNARRIGAGMRAARDAEADLVLFGELALTGYPPEDLLLREHFLADAASALRELAEDARGVVAVVGFPEWADGVRNAAAVLADGGVHAIYRKVHLPNYGVFDEQRYFQAGRTGAVLDLGEHRIGLTVCEDMWQPGPPAAGEALAGATLLVNISASPYHAGKGSEREAMFAQRAREAVACVALCALVGGQDELVFDGHSCVIDHTGMTIARAAQFREEMLVCDVDLDAAAAARPRRARSLERVEILPPLPALARTGPSARSPARSLAEPIVPVEAEVYAALTLGLRDYVEKNEFDHVVLGLSGGIDSALVACLAVDALGPERVAVAVLPSPYSSSATQNDARSLGTALGVEIHDLSIEGIMEAYARVLADALAPEEAIAAGVSAIGPAERDPRARERVARREAAASIDVPGVATHGSEITAENLQARIRGNLLMALSNRFGWLVLATGNKSEMSVGYTTLYGDLAGGFAVIKDVPKTLVYRLCQWRNSPAGAADPVPADAHSAHTGEQPARVPAPIPASIFARAPSAELRHGQRDEDSLPAYELLDRILQGYIELDEGREQLLARGLPEAEVDQTIRLVDRAEYKRRQAPPGIKVTSRAFGRDRRMPITNRYRDWREG
jgi:NAD+ synthase (glutamine-hydrolysing)